MLLQPFVEERGDFVRQPQQHVASRARAGLPRGFEHALQLHVVDHRNHRRAHHADRHTRLMQGAQHPQPRRRRRRARLHDAFELIVQRGQADRDADQPLLGQRHQQIQIAQHQRALGDDVHRMLEAQQDFQRTAGQLLFAFDGLIRIGVDAQRNGLRHVARLAQLLLEAFGEVGLGDQPRLEIDPRRHVPIGMAGPRKTVDAAVLTAAIGIDRAVEADVRRLIAGQHALGRLEPYLGGAGQRHVLFPAVVVGLASGRGETVIRVDRGAAAARRAFRREHKGLRNTVYEYSIRIRQSLCNVAAPPVA